MSTTISPHSSSSNDDFTIDESDLKHELNKFMIPDISNIIINYNNGNVMSDLKCDICLSPLYIFDDNGDGHICDDGYTLYGISTEVGTFCCKKCSCYYLACEDCSNFDQDDDYNYLPSSYPIFLCQFLGHDHHGHYSVSGGFSNNSESENSSEEEAHDRLSDDEEARSASKANKQLNDEEEHSASEANEQLSKDDDNYCMKKYKIYDDEIYKNVKKMYKKEKNILDPKNIIIKNNIKYYVFGMLNKHRDFKTKLKKNKNEELYLPINFSYFHKNINYALTSEIEKINKGESIVGPDGGSYSYWKCRNCNNIFSITDK